MDIPSTRVKTSRTAKIKTAKALKKVPTGLLLRKKAECDSKALKIVERMMEPNVDVDWLLQNLVQLNKSHMEDIVEERSIVKLCGYALCDNPLTKVINKRYQISTLRNKVYDVSRVKNYCSYGCYTAAEYLMEQMFTSPLWLREGEEIPEFRILPKKNKEKRAKSPPGVEIDLTGIRLPEDTESCEEKQENPSEKMKMQQSQETLSEKMEMRKRPKTCGSEEKCELKKPLEEKNEIVSEASSSNSGLKIETIVNLRENENPNFKQIDNDATISEKMDEVKTRFEKMDIDDPTSFCEASKIKIKTKVHFEETKLIKLSGENSVSVASAASESSRNSENRKMERRKSRESRKREIPFDTLTSRVEKSFKEWITEKTLCLLHGEITEKQKIFDNISRQEKYAVLCKKLSHLQIEEEREANERIGDLKPAPNFMALQEEAKGLELKVRAFWDGKTVIDREAEKSNVTSTKQEDTENDSILPLIDNHTPNILRRRIFLDKLNRVLPDLLRTLAGQSIAEQYSYTSDRCAMVKALVSTFSLSATNIIFKTAEWTLVALIIIKLLGIMDPRMKYLIGTKQAILYISMILMSYKLDSNYLENLIAFTNPPEALINESETT